MCWKEELGLFYSERNIYRFEYLNNRVLRPSLKDFVDYINEFDGQLAVLDDFSCKKTDDPFYANPRTYFRLQIFYPNDAVHWGKHNDRYDRRFICHIYFSSKGLNIVVYYRRSGGKFSNRASNMYNQSSMSLESENKSETNGINNIADKLTNNYRSRDIFKEVKTFEEACEPDFIGGYILYLYKEHIKHISEKGTRG